jgi:hypothetical protein
MSALNIVLHTLLLREPELEWNADRSQRKIKEWDIKI